MTALYRPHRDTLRLTSSLTERETYFRPISVSADYYLEGMAKLAACTICISSDNFGGYYEGGAPDNIVIPIIPFSPPYNRYKLTLLIPSGNTSENMLALNIAV